MIRKKELYKYIGAYDVGVFNCVTATVNGQLDMETALHRYSAFPAPSNLEHLSIENKKDLLVKLRKDIDEVIRKTDLLTAHDTENADRRLDA